MVICIKQQSIYIRGRTVKILLNLTQVCYIPALDIRLCYELPLYKSPPPPSPPRPSHWGWNWKLSKKKKKHIREPSIPVWTKKRRQNCNRKLDRIRIARIKDSALDSSACWVTLLTGLPWVGQLFIYFFTKHTEEFIYMLNRVTHLPGPPCLLARSPPPSPGRVIFVLHVNGQARAASLLRLCFYACF